MVTMGIFYFLPKQRLYLAVKRLLDIVSGISGCIFLPLLMGIVKFMNLENGDKVPLFYRQKSKDLKMTCGL